MSLITVEDASLAFADLPVLRNTGMAVDANERVCLIGRNGAGKSTLFRIILGEQALDSGEVRSKSHLRISQLPQLLPAELELTVAEYVTGGLEHLKQLIAEYHRCSEKDMDKHAMRQLQELQHQIEAEGGWHLDQRVETVLSEMGLPGEKTLARLSGGWQRRVGLARALVSNPELLLLDEPTNHLDLASIEWLENRIRSFPGSVLFITHDRVLLQKLATRILELDRTRLTSWPGNYANFLRRKEETLHAEDIDRTEFEKKLAGEEIWVRQGLKARRTRNEGRVRALLALRQEAAERDKFKRQQGPRIHIEETELESGRKVIDMHQVCYGYGDELLIDHLSLKIRRGDRIGLIGNNGVGKSTLLRLMLGEIKPHSGTVKHGTNLGIGYFDQMRRDLDPDKTVAEVVGDGRDYISLNGRERHVIGYLRGFLFSAKRAMTRVRSISGGERNRVILARLFTRASNLLVLDEPTNDLDVETLEVLEYRLLDYRGTLIVVSHDRAFLDNVVTSVLVFEDNNRVEPYVGGYSDWLRHGRQLADKDITHKNTPKAQDNGPAAKDPQPRPRKLSYNLQREYDRLPDVIGELEREIRALQEETTAADFYSRPYEVLQPVLDQLSAKQQQLDGALQRWLELENMTQ